LSSSLKQAICRSSSSQRPPDSYRVVRTICIRVQYGACCWALTPRLCGWLRRLRPRRRNRRWLVRGVRWGCRRRGRCTLRSELRSQIFHYSDVLVISQAGAVADHPRHDIPPFIRRVALGHDDIDAMAHGAGVLDDILTLPRRKHLGDRGIGEEHSAGQNSGDHGNAISRNAHLCTYLFRQLAGITFDDCVQKSKC
jgi:hypothetical protein